MMTHLTWSPDRKNDAVSHTLSMPSDQECEELL